jgi:hypothetical protein
VKDEEGVSCWGSSCSVRGFDTWIEGGGDKTVWFEMVVTAIHESSEGEDGGLG